MPNQKRDEKLFKKYMTDGCAPSPEDSRDYTIDTIGLTPKEIPEEYIRKGMKVTCQGTVSSCVAHAISTAMGYGEIAKGRTNTHDFSRGFIYANRGEQDYQGEGMYIREALKRLNHYGDCEYEDFPWNKKYPKVKAKLEAGKENYLKKAESFKILNYFRCYTDEEVKQALLNQGAVVLSAPIYSTFAAECPLPSDKDKYKGGHAMCLVGWDKTGWIIQNSWSPFWGDEGFLHLPYDYPVNEWWGITVNLDVPEPTKKPTLSQILDRIIYKLSKIWDLIKDLWKNKK